MTDDQRDDPDRSSTDDVLAASLIHEMRHPLMGIQAGLQLLAKGAGQNLVSTEEWELITTQVARLEDLFKRYQEFLHPEAVSPHQFDLGPVVKAAVELVQHRLRGLGEAFEVSVPAGRVEVVSVPGSVSHAVVNLVANALDALEVANNRGRLAIRLLPSDGRWGPEIRVSDEGPGVDAEVADRLFLPRVTTKATRQGSGLGLFLARKLMRAHGGDVALVSPSDSRRLSWAKAEFAITLSRPGADAAPAAPRPTPPVARPVPPAEATAPTTVAPGERKLAALVVDDEDVILVMLKLTLSRAGYEVTTASDGEQAAELIERGRFDVLITDKNLPRRNGVELATLARRQSPSMAIILITGFANPESAQALLNLGIDDYVEKPFDLDYLIARLRQIAARRQALERAPQRRAAARRVLMVRSDARAAALVAAFERAGAQVEMAADFSPLRVAEAPMALVAPASFLTPAAKADLWAARERSPDMVVLVLSDAGALRSTMAAISVGALRYLSLPIDAQTAEAVTKAALST